MTQEIEIEFKNLLSKDEYYSLLEKYSIRLEQRVLQQNHYFDTENFDLKTNQSALRIRKKKQSYVLTLKQPMIEGILETHQTVTEEEALHMLNGGTLIKGDVYTIIENLNILPSDIRFLGTLETYRVEIPYKKGILVFDHSLYLNVEDFELEYEATEYNEGKSLFDEFLFQHSIEARHTENKIKRFFARKEQINGGLTS